MLFSRRRVLALAVGAPGALTMFAGCRRATPEHKFSAIDLTGAQYARRLELPDVDGKTRTLAEFAGKAVVVFFGYTQCPDVCPTTMVELAQVRKLMGPDGERVQVVFVTVDPERDTAQLLKNYVKNFSPDIVALRGDAAQTQAVAREFKVFFQKVPGRTPDGYTIDHTAGSYIFDSRGRIRLFARNGMEPQLLAADLKALLASRP